MSKRLISFVVLSLAVAVADAQGASPPESRSPEDVACRTSAELLKLYPFDAGRDWQNSWLKSLNSDARQLGIYCEQGSDLQSDDAERRRSWILGVQGYDFRFMRLAVEAAAKPQTVRTRQRLTKFQDIIAELHFDAATLLTREMHRLAKPTIVEVPKEVIRTVEVVAPPPPDPNAECNRMLRQATGRWYGMATDILGPYGENGRANDAYQVVVQVRREMNGLSSDADVFPVAVSWHQRLHRAATDPANTRRTGGVFDFFQLSESEQSRIEDLAQDIRSQLRFCRGSY